MGQNLLIIHDQLISYRVFVYFYIYTVVIYFVSGLFLSNLDILLWIKR
jgi:hypothetical protein